jgi:cytidine deaminase
MEEKKIVQIQYLEVEQQSALSQSDFDLLEEAKAALKNAYAPYSNFLVSAAARLVNGKILTGTNQENASFPVGLCAERVLLSAISSIYPGVAIESIAITYQPQNGNSQVPISPCGVCRQALNEYEIRLNQPIRLILGGLTGPVWIFDKCSELLPFGFNGTHLKK